MPMEREPSRFGRWWSGGASATDQASERFRISARALRDELAGKAGFNPNQPRVPRGRHEGGQWTDSGGGRTD